MIHLHRRDLMRIAGSAALAAGSTGARGADYPTRTIKLIAPYAPGGATDVIARVTSQTLGGKLGGTIIVENRPGAGANIGTEFVIHAPADGYTLLLVSSANALNATMYPNLAFNFLRDIVPVGLVGKAANVLVVNPSVPVHNAAEFIVYVKANPGRVNLGLPGVGSPQHLAAELFRSMTGVETNFVQFRGGGPVMNDLVAGHIEAAFASTVACGEFVRAGSVRGIGVTSITRSEAVPDVPPLSDTVTGYEAVNFYGVGVPNGTPQRVIGALSRALQESLGDEKLRDQLLQIGVTPTQMSASEFSAFIAAETEKWGKIIRQAELPTQ